MTVAFLKKFKKSPLPLGVSVTVPSVSFVNVSFKPVLFSGSKSGSSSSKKNHSIISSTPKTLSKTHVPRRASGTSTLYNVSSSFSLSPGVKRGSASMSTAIVTLLPVVNPSFKENLAVAMVLPGFNTACGALPSSKAIFETASPVILRGMLKSSERWRLSPETAPLTLIFK